MTSVDRHDPPEPPDKSLKARTAAGHREHHCCRFVLVCCQNEPVVHEKLTHRHKGDPLATVDKRMVAGDRHGVSRRQLDQVPTAVALVSVKGPLRADARRPSSRTPRTPPDASMTSS